jgi:hypothetical protein
MRCIIRGKPQIHTDKKITKPEKEQGTKDARMEEQRLIKNGQWARK